MLSKQLCSVARNIKHYNMASICIRSQHGSPTTVDDGEIDRFSDVKDIFWDKDKLFRTLHTFNDIRVPFVRDCLVKLKPGEYNPTPLLNKRIVDVGCGPGILTEALTKLGADVVGLDASEALIDLAKEHSAANPDLSIKPTYVNATIEEFSEAHKNEFDAMVSSEVIEHVNNRELFAKACTKVVRPGGKVIFTTPNRTLFARLYYIWFFDLIGVIPKELHQYEKFVHYKTLKAWLEECNCHEEVSHGVWYNVIPNRWEFIKSKKMQYAICAVKRS